MPNQEKNILWFYARSILIMAVVMLPFYFLGRLLFVWDKDFLRLGYITNSIFAPIILIYDLLCSAFAYCIFGQFSGPAVLVPLYVMSIIVYGYVLALIWSWVSFPKRIKPKLPPITKNDDFF